MYMTIYLLTWTYFNDVNGGRNILINSQLKRILFMSWPGVVEQAKFEYSPLGKIFNKGQEKMKQNCERQKKQKKKIKAMKVTSLKVRYQI